ncbi:siderophore-interacting protein [Rhodococcoides kyotonense]|uniref:NADPH-dependent ferric siderophore reductase, contains FAD-binding and SIP domains n=1 Tax=Rhodococcoides kyotonense TaxID=398843 RepID=A0A239L7V0_9NOCA|nr:siderophore-interacting protein [Rhodococcus kyotonensis]SNT25923.1 NADPH-dependent ferric siderophore reductase, contains FAD-binding and SIP domains [Rhodococcus kyotonensis]
MNRMIIGEVVEKFYLTPGMIRVVFGGEDLRTFESAPEGDEYLRLHFPVDGELILPTPNPDDPDGRWIYPDNASPAVAYTVRKFENNTMTIDFVVHQGGVACEWARTCVVGDTLGIGGSRGLYEPPADVQWQMFLADATGLPALGRLVEQLPAGMKARAIVEVADASHEQTIESDADVEFVWLHGCGNGVGPSRLLEALKSAPLPTGSGYVWVAGETAMQRDIRRYLRHELKLPGSAYKVIGYWTDNSEEYDRKRDALSPEVSARLEAIWAEADGDDEESRRDRYEKALEEVGL